MVYVQRGEPRYLQVQGAGFRLQVSRFRFLEFRVSSFGFRVSGVGVRISGSIATAKPRLVQVQKFRVSGFLSCFGFEAAVFEIWVKAAGFGFEVSGSRFRV